MAIASARMKLPLHTDPRRRTRGAVARSTNDRVGEGAFWLLALERLVTSLFFFWPPVLWVARKLEEARELACDEHALTRSALPVLSRGEIDPLSKREREVLVRLLTPIALLAAVLEGSKRATACPGSCSCAAA